MLKCADGDIRLFGEYYIENSGPEFEIFVTDMDSERKIRYIYVTPVDITGVGVVSGWERHAP
jgi:hypothetical protein